MKLNKVWIVRDPMSNPAMLVDVLFEATTAELGRYISGSPRDAWEKEHHTMYTEYEEAYQDARHRLRLIHGED